MNGSQERIEAVIADPDKVLLNRAIGGNYPAGRRPLPPAPPRAFEGGFITAGEEVESPPQIELYKTVFSNFRGRSHGYVDPLTALEVSSDTYFYLLGDEFYRAQESPLQEEARRFGLGERTGSRPARRGRRAGSRPGLEVGRTSRGRAVHRPRPQLEARGHDQPVNKQGYLNVTLLQMALAYGAIANGGTVHTPSVGRRVLDPNGREPPGAVVGQADAHDRRQPGQPRLDPRGASTARPTARRDVDLGLGCRRPTARWPARPGPPSR